MDRYVGRVILNVARLPEIQNLCRVAHSRLKLGHPTSQDIFSGPKPVHMYIEGFHYIYIYIYIYGHAYNHVVAYLIVLLYVLPQTMLCSIRDFSSQAHSGE